MTVLKQKMTISALLRFLHYTNIGYNDTPLIIIRSSSLETSYYSSDVVQCFLHLLHERKFNHIVSRDNMFVSRCSG